MGAVMTKVLKLILADIKKWTLIWLGFVLIMGVPLAGFIYLLNYLQTKYPLAGAVGWLTICALVFMLMFVNYIRETIKKSKEL